MAWQHIGRGSGPGTYAVTNTQIYFNGIDPFPDPAGAYRWAGGQTWTRLSGSPHPYRIFAGGFGLVVQGQDKNIYRYLGGGDWEHIGGDGKTFAVTSNAIYGLSPDGSGVHKWIGGRNWAQVGGPAGWLYGGTYGLVATNPGNTQVHLYADRQNTWYHIGGGGSQFAVTDRTIFGLSLDKKSVHRWAGGQVWYQVGGPADQIVPCP